MKRVYPPDGHCCDEDAVLVLGRAPTETASLEVAREPMAPSESGLKRLSLSLEGFFADSVDVSPGENRLTLTAKDAHGQMLAQDVFTVMRRDSRPIPPASPLTIDSETVTPAGPCWLQPGDYLRVGALASPDARIELTAPGLLASPMTLSPAGRLTPDGQWVDTRINCFGALHWAGPRLPAAGWREAVLEIPGEAGEYSEPKPATLTLSISRKGESPIRLTLAHPLTIGGRLRYARVKAGQEAILRTAPSHQARRLTPQPGGVLLAIDASIEETAGERWHRARLGAGCAGWTRADALEEIQLEDMKLAAMENTPEKTLIARPVRLLRARAESPTDVKISIEGAGDGPTLIDAQARQLRLRLSRTVAACDVAPQPARHPALTALRWEQLTPDCLEIACECPSLSGYDWGRDADGLWLRLKTLPERIQDVRLLIDPGHGGDEPGALALDSSPEKDLNLAVALALRDALQDAGFTRVAMTRQSDCAVSLSARAAMAQDSDVCLSLHHNALPDGRSPQPPDGTHQGVGGYFYQPFSRALAAHLQQALVFDLSCAADGLYEDSLVMTRPTQTLAVLLELGYLTHPRDVARVRAPEYATKVANSLAQALSGFSSSS